MAGDNLAALYRFVRLPSSASVLDKGATSSIGKTCVDGAIISTGAEDGVKRACWNNTEPERTRMEAVPVTATASVLLRANKMPSELEFTEAELAAEEEA